MTGLREAHFTLIQLFNVLNSPCEATSSPIMGSTVRDGPAL